jgi:hypothetical protein
MWELGVDEVLGVWGLEVEELGVLEVGGVDVERGSSGGGASVRLRSGGGSSEWVALEGPSLEGEVLEDDASESGSLEADAFLVDALSLEEIRRLVGDTMKVILKLPSSERE